MCKDYYPDNNLWGKPYKQKCNVKTEKKKFIELLRKSREMLKKVKGTEELIAEIDYEIEEGQNV